MANVATELRRINNDYKNIERERDEFKREKLQLKQQLDTSKRVNEELEMDRQTLLTTLYRSESLRIPTQRSITSTAETINHLTEEIQRLEDTLRVVSSNADVISLERDAAVARQYQLKDEVGRLGREVAELREQRMRVLRVVDGETASDEQEAVNVFSDCGGPASLQDDTSAENDNGNDRDAEGASSRSSSVSSLSLHSHDDEYSADIVTLDDRALVLGSPARSVRREEEARRGQQGGEEMRALLAE
ncbi:hypothetical protein HK101_007032, partial [Irineochytrium annulatum]